MSYTDTIIALGIGIWLSVIAGAIVLFARFTYECWREHRHPWAEQVSENPDFREIYVDRDLENWEWPR